MLPSYLLHISLQSFLICYTQDIASNVISFVPLQKTIEVTLANKKHSD